MAVNQFHLGKNGVEECGADPSKPNARGCPFEEDGHYDNEQQAEGALAFKMKQQGNTGTLKKAEPTFDLTKNSGVLKNIAHVEKNMKKLEKDYEKADDKVIESVRAWKIAEGEYERMESPTPDDKEKVDALFKVFDKDYVNREATVKKYHDAEEKIRSLKERITANNKRVTDHENVHAIYDFSEFDKSIIQRLGTRDFTGIRDVNFDFSDGFGKVKRIDEIKEVRVEDYKESDPEYDPTDNIFAEEGRLSVVADLSLEFSDESFIDARLRVTETGIATVEHDLRDGRNNIPIELHKVEKLLKKMNIKLIGD